MGSYGSPCPDRALGSLQGHPGSCKPCMECRKPLFGYTGVWLKYVQSLTASFFSTPFRNPLYIWLIHWIVSSFPTHPASLNPLLQQRPGCNQVLGPSHKITGKHRLEFTQSSLPLEAEPTSQWGQGAHWHVQLSLENLHSLSGLLLWCLTMFTVPIFFCMFESPLWQRTIFPLVLPPCLSKSWGRLLLGSAHPIPPLSSPCQAKPAPQPPLRGVQVLLSTWAALHRKLSFLCISPETRHSIVGAASPVPSPGGNNLVPSPAGCSPANATQPAVSLHCYKATLLTHVNVSSTSAAGTSQLRPQEWIPSLGCGVDSLRSTCWTSNWPSLGSVRFLMASLSSLLRTLWGPPSS